MRQPISVIIPSRGDSPFLRAALQSAADAGAAEIVVALPEPIDPAPELSVPLVQVPVTRRRCSVGRNAAIAAARHRRVALLDDDDLYLPNHLEVLDRLFDEYPDAPLVTTRARYFEDDSPDGTGVPPQPRDTDRIHPDASVGTRVSHRELLMATYFAVCAVGVDRDRIPPGALHFDEELPVLEDYETWLRLTRFGDVAVGDEVTLWIRKRPKSDSRNVRAMAQYGLRILGERSEEAREAGLSTDEWNRRLGRLWHDLAWAELAHGSGAECRQALARARQHGVRHGRDSIYLLASWLPLELRRLGVDTGATH
ncbi:hypothetical protein ABI59_08145 [Acidobacteria bacterium Mor1]|nr:hypothetical protein ABI59_08145 [Acidobacteria bacterium Mor1]